VTRSLVSPTRIFTTLEAHECYDLLCGQRKNASLEVLKRQKELLGKHLFDDTVQAFYVAAAVGHLVQRGKRYEVKGKVEELILRQHWERAEKRDLRKAFTYLAKLEYGAKNDENESLQIVAELAERGIRFIRDKVVDAHEFDFKTMLDPLRRMTKERGDLE
jgi:hypothetical protein